MKDLIHRSSGKHIQNGKQVVIAYVGTHINVLNVQAEVFHRVACHDLRMLNKLAFTRRSSGLNDLRSLFIIPSFPDSPVVGQKSNL